MTLAQDGLYGTAYHSRLELSDPMKVPALWWLSIPADELGPLAESIADLLIVFHYSTD
jgi:hypothetical protein